MDIKVLNISELVAVINSYPWYAAARMELCRRMMGMGDCSEIQLSETAMYMGSRSIIADLVRASRSKDYSDSDMEALLKSLLESAEKVVEQSEKKEGEARRFFVVGGDYFSQSQYDTVRRESDGIFSSFAAKESNLEYHEIKQEPLDLCTETLASIYQEQGYLQEAKEIYSKLSLRYPEKSVYFAALIEKIDNNK